MTSFRRQLLIKGFMLSDLAIMLVSYGLGTICVFRANAPISLAQFLSLRIRLTNFVLFLALVLAWHLALSLSGLYESKRLGNRRSEARDVLKATSLGTLIIGVMAILFHIRMATPVFVLVFWAASTAIAISTRLLLRYVLQWVRLRGRNLQHILIIGSNGRALRFAQLLDSRPELGYRIIGFVDDQWAGAHNLLKTPYQVVCEFQHLPSFLRERVVDEVAVALPMKSFYLQASSIVALCQEHGIVVRFVSSIFDVKRSQSQSGELDVEQAVTVYTPGVEGWPVVVKRFLDMVSSATLLTLLAPLLLIISIFIKLDSPGPVLFVQERVGLNKRRFRMFKFRTMGVDAEARQKELEHRNEADGPVFKIKNDPRITSVGRFLRETSIDELPQLINVLKGDMSLVGPRPLPVRDYQGLDQDWHRRRFSVRPGITCLWQINGRSSLPFAQWMDLDMQYIDEWSLWLDLKILAKTVPAVLKAKGAI